MEYIANIGCCVTVYLTDTAMGIAMKREKPHQGSVAITPVQLRNN
jgi:hypothetical protein